MKRGHHPYHHAQPGAGTTSSSTMSSISSALRLPCRRNAFLSAICAALICAAGSGCSTEAENSGETGAPVPPPTIPAVVVSPEWVLENREERGLVLVDVRSVEEFREGHLPGAIHLPEVNTVEPDTDPKKFFLARPEVILDFLGGAGLSTSTPIVIYGTDNDYRPAGRFFWIMEVHGYRNICVMNGGPVAWEVAGGEIHQDATTVPPISQDMNFKLMEERYADKEEVIAAIEDETTILIDARPKPQYLGEQSIEGQARAGRIPSAESIPFHTLIEPVPGGSVTDGIGRLKPPADLRLVYKGVDDADNVIFYCNDGRASGLAYLALRSAGHKRVAVYDRSWWEWADTELPIEVGR